MVPGRGVQTKSLDEGLREAEASLSTANSQLAALGRALGTKSPADLQAALDARLAEFADASSELRDTRRRLQVRHFAVKEVVAPPCI